MYEKNQILLLSMYLNLFLFSLHMFWWDNWTTHISEIVLQKLRIFYHHLQYHENVNAFKYHHHLSQLHEEKTNQTKFFLSSSTSVYRVVWFFFHLWVYGCCTEAVWQNFFFLNSSSYFFCLDLCFLSTLFHIKSEHKYFISFLSAYVSARKKKQKQ